MVTVKHEFHDIDSWLKIESNRFKPDEIAQFRQAIDIAKPFYDNQKFYPTDVDLMLHALTCAHIVGELNLFADAVTAILLFALPRFCQDDWEKRLEVFDPKVTELVDGINKVTEIRKLGTLADVENEEDRYNQIEIIRKMLLAMVSDIRVVLLVLVGRGELMLHLNTCKDNNMVRKIALETVEIFSPLANRLGLWQIKWELEDLSFKYLHPDQYRKIAKLLDETREERLDYIEQIKEFISSQMKESGITDYQVMGRAKHIYSIWKKMKKKNYDFDDLYDIRAVRILVPEIKDCYTVLGIVHTKYSPIPGEFDDYISNPKSNNYQSLHTCVVGPDSKVIEIQIRTFAMHDHAEYGIAAHWRYKEFGEKGADKTNADFAEKVAWLRQILDWREELNTRQDVANLFKNEIFNDSIYVMTPTGKVISLPKGSTPIDFAYNVHSEVGHKCRGAKVDGQIVPLSTPLQNGQRIEILTVKEGGPSINWLHDGMVKSSKAIGHIRRYIRDQNQEDFFTTGAEIFERELAKFAANTRPDVKDIITKLGFDNEKALFIDLGRGDLSPSSVRDTIQRLMQKSEKNIDLVAESNVTDFIQSLPTKIAKTNGILVDGVSGIVTQVAKCCKPLPGDTIIGFITQGSGVAIHRSNCSGIKRQAKLYPNKVVHVDWGGSIDRRGFIVDMEVIANDRTGLLRDLTDLFAVEKLSISGLRTICKNNKAIMVFTIQLTSADFNFNWISSRVMSIEGVFEVSRK